MINTAKITQLAADYQRLIGSQHHKDSDCHWSIECRWSYGNAPRYIVRHSGYLHGPIEVICDSLAGAEAILMDELGKAVELEKIAQEADGYFSDAPGELRAAFEL